MQVTTTFNQHDGDPDDEPRCPFCRVEIGGPCALDCFADHNGECVGCQTRLGLKCPDICPLRTGEPSAPMTLRLAAKLLDLHRQDVGYNIGEAIFAAANLIGWCDPWQLTEGADAAITGYLIRQYGPDCGRDGEELLEFTGRWVQLDVIALTLYAAAAEAEGVEFDAAAFGTLPASPQPAYPSRPVLFDPIRGAEQAMVAYYGGRSDLRVGSCELLHLAEDYITALECQVDALTADRSPVIQRHRRIAAVVWLATTLVVGLPLMVWSFVQVDATTALVASAAVTCASLLISSVIAGRANLPKL